MFDSFKTVCYVPLIVFALGWALSQFIYLYWKKGLSEYELTDELRTTVLKNNTDILFLGMSHVVLLLLGIYLGVYVRWFLIGLEVVLILIYFIRIAASIDFANAKLKKDKIDWLKLTLLPLILQLSCSLLAGSWMVFVFWVTGLVSTK